MLRPLVLALVLATGAWADPYDDSDLSPDPDRSILSCMLVIERQVRASYHIAIYHQ